MFYLEIFQLAEFQKPFFFGSFGLFKQGKNFNREFLDLLISKKLHLNIFELAIFRKKLFYEIFGPAEFKKLFT